MGLPIANELLTIILKNPIIAWFTIIFVLSTDTFLTGLVFPDGAGLVGFILSSVLSGLGLDIPITSFQVLIVVAFTPLLVFILKKS